MNLTFRLRFHTRPGQSLALAGDHPLPGHPVPLHFLDSEHWQVSIPLTTQAAETAFAYSYIFVDGDQRTTDWGRDRVLRPASFKCSELLVLDAWNNAGFPANVFDTVPFRSVLLADNFTAVKTVAPKNPTHTFRVAAPLLPKNQTLCLLGQGAALGNWRTEKPLLLGRKRAENVFSIQLDLRGQTFPLAYKYGVYDVAQKAFVGFESGADRVLPDEIGRDQHTLVNDGFVRLPDDTWRGAGVAVPVFSLRSEHSWGVGEFLDLKPLADWGKQVGLKLIQLLPVNDTSATGTWKDSYPYAAISAFALHPLYLNLDALTEAKNKKLLRPLAAARLKLNRLKTVDYEAVM